MPVFIDFEMNKVTRTWHPQFLFIGSPISHFPSSSSPSLSSSVESISISASAEYNSSWSFYNHSWRIKYGSGKVQGKFKEGSEKVQGIFQESSGMVQGMNLSDSFWIFCPEQLTRTSQCLFWFDLDFGLELGLRLDNIFSLKHKTKEGI